MDVTRTDVRIPCGAAALHGDLVLPVGAQGLVLFAHGSGSSRHSSRNQQVARSLQQRGLGTLLFDLLTAEEERVDQHTREFRFDIPRLAIRMVEATRWAQDEPATAGLRIGYFGASTGSAAALIAAATLGDAVSAVVSRGGRPDLAGEALPDVRCPTLLIVGGNDNGVIELNTEAFAQLRCVRQLEIVPGATHLFEEPGTLEQVEQLAGDWFARHLAGSSSP